MMSSKKKIFISIIAFGIINILLIVLVIYPLFKAIKRNSQALLSEKERIFLLTRERESLEKMEKVFLTYQSDLDKIKNLFLDPAVPIDYINFLEKSASASQLELKVSSIGNRETKKNDPWPSLTLSISVTGSFPNFLEFLEKLENSPYLVEILSFNTTTKLREKGVEKELPLETKTTLRLKVFTK